MPTSASSTRWRRPALCAALLFWLTGYWFFPGAYSHIMCFWWLVAPLVILNANALPQLKGQRWPIVLLALLVWQLLVSSRHPGSIVQVGGLLDALSVALFAVALSVIARGPGCWQKLRWTVFAVAIVTTAWSLLRFYPLGGLGLADERLRNVLVYERGLNAVLTGLLTGFAMLAGITLDDRSRPLGLRIASWTGIAVLGFALMATQSRGAMAAFVLAVLILLWQRRLSVVPALAATVLGIAAYLLVFAICGGGDPAPDLISRGSTGRTEIWKTYLDLMNGSDWLIGKGQVPPLEASVLGWYVHHPHSSYLSQVIQSGPIGLALLATFTTTAFIAAWRLRTRDIAPLALLTFGLSGLLIDGAQIASLISLPRIEPLLVIVPAIIALQTPTRS